MSQGADATRLTGPINIVVPFQNTSRAHGYMSPAETVAPGKARNNARLSPLQLSAPGLPRQFRLTAGVPLLTTSRWTGPARRSELNLSLSITEVSSATGWRRSEDWRYPHAIEPATTTAHKTATAARDACDSPPEDRRDCDQRDGQGGARANDDGPEDEGGVGTVLARDGRRVEPSPQVIEKDDERRQGRCCEQ